MATISSTYARPSERGTMYELRQPYQLHLYVDAVQYEYITRLQVRHKLARQKFLQSRVFPPDWKKELAVLRAADRKDGIPDIRFLPRRIQRSLRHKQ